MTFNIYNILILTGIIQGFIFGIIVVISKWYKSKSILFLIGMIVSYSLGNLQYILPDIGLITSKEMYSYVYLPLASIIAPLLYFHVVFFLNPKRNLSVFDKLLVTPFLLFLIIVVTFRLCLIFNIGLRFIDQTFMNIVIFHELLSIFMSLFILLLILVLLVTYEKANKTFKIEFIKPQLKWLKLTVMILLLLTILWAYITFVNLIYPERAMSYYGLWLGIAAIIYWLGHNGIYRFGIIKERSQLRKHILDKTAPIAIAEFKNAHIKTFQHFLIDQKMYLNPNLTLEKFAESMKISPGHLSRIIKSDLRTNFTDIVNAKRVEAAKSYLENPKFSNYTIIAIGLEAGFNSKSAFFEVFKKLTGKTPTEYKKIWNNTSI